MYGRRVGDKLTEASGGQTETGLAVSLRCVVSLTPHTCEVKVLEDYRRKKSLNAFVEIGLRRKRWVRGMCEEQYNNEYEESSF